MSQTQVSYDRQTVNHPSPLSRFSHRSRMKRSLQLLSKYTPTHGHLLDFGAGPGDLLNEVHRKRIATNVFAFEPFMKLRFPFIRNFKEIDEIPSTFFECITCFETIEHLQDDEFEEFMRMCKRALKHHGKLIISVPIMIGPALLVKEITRMALFRRPSEYRLQELFYASIFSLSPDRPDDRRPTHKGFDFRALLRRLREETWLLEVETQLSPLRGFPFWLNSQVFQVLEKVN